MKKARHCLYDLRILRKFKISTGLQRTFLSAVIQSVITGCITTWYCNCHTQGWKSLHRVIQCAEHITRTALPCLQDISPSGAGLKRPGSWRTFTTPPMNFLWSCLLASTYAVSWPGLSPWRGVSSFHCCCNCTIACDKYTIESLNLESSGFKKWIMCMFYTLFVYMLNGSSDVLFSISIQAGISVVQK